MRWFFYIIGFLFSFSLSVAQNTYFYYYKGEKIYLNLDKNSFTLIADNTFIKEDIDNLFIKDFELKKTIDDSTIKYSKIELLETLNEDLYFKKLNSISALQNVIAANPNFKSSTGERLGLSNFFYVKLKNKDDYHLLEQEAMSKNVIIVEKNAFMPLWFTLKTTKYTLENTLEIANYFIETGFFSASQPDFLSNDIICSNDPLFGSLWGLKNNTNPNIDINLCNAWAVTQGENVMVAVLDQGIDKNHIDLNLNISPLSYNTETNSSPSQLFATHGTHVAGIIAAIKNNNKQVVGVAPASKLMDVSNSMGSTPNSRIKRADGINWAWQNGADVINNSWVSSVSYQAIDEAIENAIQYGRGGKGTVVIFGVGNNNGKISYPAKSNPNIITVGSVTSDGSRSGFSNYGNELDVVAPGSHILSTVPSNQVDYMDGTSMATPHVSGVAALILSVNPNLTNLQVNDIIEGTAQKIRTDLYTYSVMPQRPNGTWNNQMGYGLINACASILVTSLGIEPFSTPTITSNTIISTEKYVAGDIIIESGVTLTIKSKIRFADIAKIIIKPGAKLIIDGGTLTNSGACGSFWQGIEVYGTSNQHQYPSNNPTYQGMLIVKNGGIIENAHIGATNWKKDDYTKIGGVIQANGGIFRNNRRDVVFMTYSNFSETNPAIKRANLSYFNNTDFLSDNNFIEKGLAIQSHVSMWQVSGINFTNCRFANNVTNKLNSTAPNTAISSIDAGYKIDAACSTAPPLGQPCPSGNLLKSSFTGFNTAIDANGSGTTETVTIQQSNFTNNVNGIRIDDFDNVSINRNSINIGSAGYPFFLQGTGISITNSTGYIVEENTISKTAVTPTYGIAVNNSGTANNRLYKNTLNALSYGNHFSGVNKNFVLMGTNTGLQFLCNNYSGNTVGTYIGGASDWTHGVNISQGESSKSAGNVFSGNTNSIYNSANWTINYYHHGGTSIPTSNVGSVTLYTATANTCPSSFGGGLILMKGQSNGYLDSLENQSQNLKTTYNELYYTYLSQLDGGNTEKLKAKIENNWSEDAWILRANLLEKSPYLSAEILLETAQLGTLPNAMLLEICMANPDATKSAYFTEKLNEVTNGTFPQYMQEYIRTNDQKTARTQLESQMASVYSELSTTKNFIKNSKATKDEYTTADRYNLSANGKELSDKIAQIDFFIENSQWTKADSVLQIIQNDKTYQDNLSLLEDFDKYIAFRAGLGERTLAELKAYEISFLQELAVKEQRISGYARNILCYFYQLCYDKEYTDDHATQKIMLQKEQNSYLEPIETTLYSVSIYPNPAKEFVNLSWEILDELKECHYQVVNLNGQLVEKGIIPQNKGELTLDTRNYQNGIYVISVFNGNELKATKKLVVEKMK